MAFAGDVPNGSKVRFMKANFDKLVDAATHAAGLAVSKITRRAALRVIDQLCGPEGHL